MTIHNFNFHEKEFNFFNNLSEEVVEQRGIEIYFLPRTAQRADLILGEDTLSRFEDKYKIIMYLTNHSEFEGDGSIFGQFGLHVTDQSTFEIPISAFKAKSNNMQPLEGDLVFVPMGDFIFEIFNVKEHDPFYYMGKPSKYIFNMRKFEYSSEEMNTGIDELDVLDDLQSTDIESENDTMEDEIDDILNSTEPSIFGDK